MAAEWIVASAGLTVTVVTWALFAARQRRAAIPPPDQVRRIRINGDYQPAEVHIRAGEPARLIFRREETAPCSERVVFPDYGLSVMLPPFEDVAVDLPASEPGEHEFTCQMQMLHGRLVVEGDTSIDPHSPAAASPHRTAVIAAEHARIAPEVCRVTGNYGPAHRCGTAAPGPTPTTERDLT